MKTSDTLQRTILLYGEQGLEALSHSRVIVFGVGGVGSWCCEALVRTGVGSIAMVDADNVDVSNINRQLPATTTTIGRPKVEVMAERLRHINPDCHIEPIQRFYDADTAESFDLASYDVVIDAIDSLASKAHLILAVTRLKDTRLFSSMGAAQRKDPGMVKVAEFWRVRGCPLARALRDRFKRTGTSPRRKLQCVYSDEPPGGLAKGTSMAVTATFGLRLAALAINHLLDSKK